MHQGHTIPWTIISRNFKLVKEDKRYTPPLTGLSLSTDQKVVQKELKHFIGKFITAITTFSETERNKYSTTFPAPRRGKLFSDEILHRHPEFLNETNQKIEYWIYRAVRGGYYYAPDLADVITVLLHENAMETLLMLSHHPQIPVGNLCRLSQGYHPGFSGVKYLGLRCYLFFSTAEAVGVLDKNPLIAFGEQFNSLLGKMLMADCPRSQQVPHRRFLQECGILTPDNNLHLDRPIPYSQQKAYMKDIFALLYRYDVFERECKINPRWDRELAFSFPLSIGIKLEWDQSLGDYMFAE